MKLDSRLKSLRLEKNLTQKQLASRMGVAVSTISSYELGTNNPPYDVLLLYADIFHVTTDFILGRDTASSPSINVKGLNEKEIKAVQALVDTLRSK